MDLHVDLIGDNSWFGGGLKQVEGPDGTVTVRLQAPAPSFSCRSHIASLFSPSGAHRGPRALVLRR
jgi:hypothetical protein